MREIRSYGSEGGGIETNRCFLPLSRPPGTGSATSVYSKVRRLLTVADYSYRIKKDGGIHDQHDATGRCGLLRREMRARIGAGAIACYSVFRRIHSLMRPYKFADPLRREFAYIMMNSLHELGQLCT